MMKTPAHIYGYGSEGELIELVPGESTDTLASNGFMMKLSITGAQFYSLSSVVIITAGYLIDTEEGSNPCDVWRMALE